MTTFPVSLVGPQSYLLFHNVYPADRQVMLVPKQRTKPQRNGSVMNNRIQPQESKSAYTEVNQ